MKKLLSTSQIVSDFKLSDRVFEVCAMAEANFDETPSILVVELAAFLRPVAPKASDKQLTPEWLPKKQTLTEHVTAGEASDLAREIFQRWVQTVRQSIPTILNKKGTCHALQTHHST